ncbi:MAG: cobalt transporter CbiM, partial [Deltaproteobacteria bacterium]
PVWYAASRRVERSLKLRRLPLLAMGAAFTFVIMMFNIPIPGGSGGHMVGATVAAIVLGPWAGVVALSLALTLQAFLFADGGVTTLAANCFNMAFVMSFAGYYTYRALSYGDAGGVRRFLSAAAAAYIAVILAALSVAIELGIQPHIAHGIDGRPLYAPYPLSVTIPAMTIPHLLFFAPVEALGTALVVSYAHKTGTDILYRPDARLRPLWAVLVALVVLTPLGLIFSGTPWGEWGMEELLGLTGYLPQGMERLGGLWRGVLPGYNLPGSGGIWAVVFYVVSAALGSSAVVSLIYLWGRLWPR